MIGGVVVVVVEGAAVVIDVVAVVVESSAAVKDWNYPFRSGMAAGELKSDVERLT